jgi:hypothetical protein
MPITDNDIRFRASERMTDFDDGGGRMSDVIILDGVDNNVFPDVTDIERLTGKVSLRKVYAGAFNADTDTFLSSHTVLDIPPVDDDTHSVVFSYGGLSTERDEADAALAAGAPDALQIAFDSGAVFSCSAEWTGGGTSVTLTRIFLSDGFWSAFSIGQTISLTVAGVRHLVVVTADAATEAVSVGLKTRAISVTATPGAGAQTGTAVLLTTATLRCHGVAEAPGITSSGATSITVDTTWAQIIPADPALAYPVVEVPAWNITALPHANTHGRAQAIAAGDALLVHHTEAMAPDTVANSDVVDTGRTGLARLRVIGSTGVEHARFTDGQDPPVGVGCTADLTAGTVTFTDVSGMAQPVTVEHRIEEMALATTVTLTTVNLNRALSREYPAGTRVSSLLMVGDLQGRATAGFAQQAWTGVWSDAIIGGTPVGDFNDAAHPIACTNAGAVTERWAAIFTNTTSYRVIGETLGEIGTGSTGGDFEPLNPVTGEPYFSLAAVGWGAGWAAGNVYRFNTIGAVAPVWALRCVAPSTPSGDDSVTLELRGYVNT